MLRRLRGRWQGLLENLWFVPGAIVVGAAGLALLFVHGGSIFLGEEAAWTFGGDASAARVLLSTVAGSLITIAGLTFSITIVALQLTASQLTPRALRNVFADRLTQVTMGVFVGTFVYCLLVLRAVRDEADAGEFVPRLGVTLAIAFAVFALALLIAFIHHVSRLVQVSYVASRIAGETLGAIERLYPDRFGREADEHDLPAEPERSIAAQIFPRAPGYVVAVDLDRLGESLEHGVIRIAIPVCPGDFAGVDTALALVWPRTAAGDTVDRIRDAFRIASERTMLDDAMFGLRQLADIAIRALSPSLNDPTTAVTCIGYLQSILVILAGRRFPSRLRRFDDVVVTARVRTFDEYVEALVEVGRHARGDARVTARVLEALQAVAAAAVETGAHRRSSIIVRVAAELADAARDGRPQPIETAREGVPGP